MDHIVPSCETGDPWYVVRTQARKEVSAATLLREHLGLPVYVPLLRRQTREGRRQTPFFPSYIFMQANLHRVQLSSIHTCPGVLRVLGVDKRPQAISSEVLAAIQVCVDRLNAQGGLPRYNFHPGDRVRITAGPFEGLEAMFMGSGSPQDRVHILLEFLGGLREVQLDAAALERLPAVPAHTHKRGTRGRGRSLHYPAPVQ
jgi:transcriptional antiterminator RfaH